jgi:acyl phosphate:glycerol-3-phosphate acyltransferase
MISIYTTTALIVAYLYGSIPTAIWIGKAFYGIDVREYGSGNAGATNTFRTLGKKAGIPVLIIDILKGFTATNLVYFIGNYTPGTVQFANFQIVLGITAVIGHIFPVFAGFRGGKGIATLFGMILAVHPAAAALSVGAFVVVLMITRYVSLSSMIASFMFPVIIILFFNHSTTRTQVLFAIAVCILVMITHQKNIERLIKGRESKVNLFKKS